MVRGPYLERRQGRGGFSTFFLQHIDLKLPALDSSSRTIWSSPSAIGLAAMPRPVRHEFVAAAKSPGQRHVQLRGNGRKGARFAHETGIYMRSAAADYESWLDIGDYLGMAEDIAVRNSSAHDLATPGSEDEAAGAE